MAQETPATPGEDRGRDEGRRTILVISQVYVPDPASLGQHMAEAAAELARRGHRVIALASRRGYEDPRQVYARQELLNGVDVRRLPASSFGKASIPLRVLGAASFLLQVLLRGLMLRRLDGILVSTSPPMGSLAALLVGLFRRAPVTYWAMDINPDQAVALQAVGPHSWVVRLFDLLNRAILRRAARVVTLDHFMAQRLCRKAELRDRLVVLPPWSLETIGTPVEHALNPFRRHHALDGKFVLMYSGNISLAHPLDTLLSAALRLQHRPELEVLLIGGGQGQRAVEAFLAEHRPCNVRLLPYQPLSELRHSLSAADVHLVSMGQAMVGIVHPCKVYGAMAAARPILLLGPRDCHVGELIQRHQLGWQVEHGDVDGLVALVQRLLDGDPAPRAAVGLRARAVLHDQFDPARLCAAFCDVVEGTLCRQAPAARRHTAG